MPGKGSTLESVCQGPDPVPGIWRRTEYMLAVILTISSIFSALGQSVSIWALALLLSSSCLIGHGGFWLTHTQVCPWVQGVRTTFSTLWPRNWNYCCIFVFDKFWTLVAGEFKHLPSPRALSRCAYSFGLCHFWHRDQLFIQIPFHPFHLSNCQVDYFLLINQAAYLSSFYLASQLIVILFGSCFSFVDGS